MTTVFRTAALALAVLLASPAARAATPPNPMIFVHGGSGSAAQFASQAMRFTSNGYPQHYLAAVEYDSGGLAFPQDLPIVHAAIDAKIAELQALTGRPQVDLLGHSRGTTVSHAYLAFPERAAKVAHYVNIDGQPAAAPPGGVPTLALWAGAVDRPVQGQIVGAINVTIPNQEHVEVATSAESFAEIYRFFRGTPPATTDILTEPPGRVTVAGRAVIFPDNVGIDGATVEVWEVDGDTGFRRRPRPNARLAIDAGGEFGPVRVLGGRHYEFVVHRENAVPTHYFYEPFVRSDHFVRLNVAPLLDPFLPGSERSTGMAIIRYKEYWGDRGPENDVLSVDGTNVVNPVTAPSGQVGAAAVAFFVLDAGQDGITNLTTVPVPFGVVPFLTGVDLFIPSEPPGTVPVVITPRGDASATRVVNVRRMPSATNRIVVQLHDFEQPPGHPGRGNGRRGR